MTMETMSLDANDAFPLDSTESVDTDNDGTGDNADTDDDDDSVLDQMMPSHLIPLNPLIPMMTELVITLTLMMMTIKSLDADDAFPLRFN